MVSIEVGRMLGKCTLDAECSCDEYGMLRIWGNDGGYGIVLILAFYFFDIIIVVFIV